MSYITSPVLFLNKSWNPMMVKPVADAITAAVKGDVLIMDPDDYNVYDFKSWVASGYGRDMSGNVDYNVCLLGPEAKTVKGVKFSFKAPEIVVHTDYNEMPELELRWGRKNLALRDNNECQYCGKKIYGEEVTIDHVTPKSMGGKNSWTNTVIACFHCNTQKRDRTPEQARMVLRTKPVKPKWYPLTARYTTKMPASWAKWVPDWAEHPLAK